jgi:toxin YoeB
VTRRPREQPRREPIFDPEFLEHLDYWQRNAPAVATRLLRLVDVTLQDPFHGIGKPEPLRFDKRGRWPRRLTSADRVVYRVAERAVWFLSARHHYDDD